MKLSKRNTLFISFMLFSMFFGAGNLIFPPFLGQSAGAQTLSALLGFLATGVVLPVLGVVVISQADGLDKLTDRVGAAFTKIFTLLIFLSIGPGLAIPRAASVPFEMAVAPYLPEGSNLKLFMLGYSLIFFLLAAWLSLTPSKLVERMGSILTPILLLLMAVLFAAFLIGGKNQVAPAQGAYAAAPFLTGFREGYLTMDAIAALNFGVVIATTLRGYGISNNRSIISCTLKTGALAGGLLAVVYIMLAYMGCSSSGVYPLQDNGAWTLRCIVAQLFGEPGAILLASIFTLACLTTCVGLITSLSEYFSQIYPTLSYKALVIVTTVFSFLICNQGLNTILSVSVPVLEAIYPMCIALILLGLCHRWISRNPYIYPCVIAGVGLVSVLYALETCNVPLGFVSTLLSYLPFYSLSFGWVSVGLVMALFSYLLMALTKKKA